MITFDEFNEYMTYVMKKEEADSAIQSIFSEYRDVYADGMVPVDNGTVIIVELLEKIFNLPVSDIYGSTLSWWIWEQDCGKKFNVGDMEVKSLPEGHKFRRPDLRTLEGLYDFLVWEGTEEDKKE